MLFAVARGAMLVCAVVGLQAQAQAQPYPSKAVTMVLPYAPGGTVDIQGRLLASGLTQQLGQPFIERNMPGATGAIATEFVAHAVPDGYTLLFCSSAQTTGAPLTEKVNYKYEDLAPISASGRGVMVLAINAKLPAHDLREFIAYAKGRPGQLSYGSAGSGSVTHLVSALFIARAGIEAVHVPYKGGSPALNDLLGGQIPMYFGNSGEVVANAQSDRMRIIGVSTLQRMKQLPQVPAVAEVLPGFTMTAWMGLLGPAQVPRGFIETLSAAVQRLSKDPTVIERLEQVGVEAITTTPEQMDAMIRAEQTVYAEAVRAAGITRGAVQ